MTQTDSLQLKETSPNESPSTPSQVSVPPPYDTVAPRKASNHEREATWDDATFDTRPGNHLKISRSSGALTGFRFTIDPNIQVPSSLRPSSLYTSANLDLGVKYDCIEADVDVLPYLDDGVKKVHIRATTDTGNITLRVNAAPDTPLVITTKSNRGAIRIHIPRTFLGPIALSSPARLSAALRRAATPLRQENGTTHWFVGDVAAWSARDELGDTWASAASGSSTQWASAASVKGGPRGSPPRKRL
ncbi:hypothetical protein C8R46DRAFT_1220729 [Mycena filopes]|nr:hypothetical protein C8R46DRAFT_1220729 [Mycena filopes]